MVVCGAGGGSGSGVPPGFRLAPRPTAVPAAAPAVTPPPGPPVVPAGPPPAVPFPAIPPVAMPALGGAPPPAFDHAPLGAGPAPGHVAALGGGMAGIAPGGAAAMMFAPRIRTPLLIVIN